MVCITEISKKGACRMRILKYELKKIWHPGVLVALAILGVVFGYLFLEMPLKYFYEQYEKEQYEQMKQWTKKYGTTLEENEYTDVQKEFQELIARADTMIKKEERFSKEGITTYEDLSRALLCIEEEVEREPQEWENLLYSEEFDRIGYQIDNFYDMLFCYDIRYQYFEEKKENKTAVQQKRIDDLIQNRKLDGIMPFGAMGNINEYSRWAITFILLSILILLAPVVTRDRLTNMQQLQWSSKQGRKVLITQLGAVLLSTAILVIIELVIFIGVYSTLGTQFFWNNPIHTFEYAQIFWFDLTYGQYVICMIGITIVLSLGMAGIAFVLSRYSRHYISLLFKVVPVFVIFALFIHVVLIDEGLFNFTNMLSRITGIAGIEVWSAVGIFLIATTMCIYTLWHEKSCEV
ncbi:MAG: hypothetical protein HDT30_00820 [Clostridiales bacterium]|nr:hypothetical protein [Clostridiales bacterium]